MLRETSVSVGEKSRKTRKNIPASIQRTACNPVEGGEIDEPYINRNATALSQ